MVKKIAKPAKSGMANPAAVFAKEQGLDYNIKTDASGNQYGVVTDPKTGVSTEEWAYYRQNKPTTPTVGVLTDKPIPIKKRVIQPTTSAKTGRVSTGMANPAATWAKQMGLDYRIVTGKGGGQHGVIAINKGGKERLVNAWGMFRQFKKRKPGRSRGMFDLW